MIVNALIEVWPRETAIYVHELPGMFASGADPDSALDQLPDQVEHHLAWLNTHGAGLDGSDSIEINLAEQLQASDGATGPLFEADRLSPSAAEIERGLAVAMLAARDLVDLYRSVPEPRRERITDAGGWSLRDHLHHVASMNLYYVAAINRTPPRLAGDPVRDVLQSTTYAVETLRSMDSSSWGTVHERLGEQWTAGKSLRRMTAHLREHYPWVRRLVSA